MPVLGHAVVGWATAIWSTRSGASTSAGGWFDALRLPMLIALAYAPDIAAQIGERAGFRHAAAFTHSIGFAIAACGGIAVIGFWHKQVRSQLVPLSMVSIVLHNLMDLLQAGDRWFAWPIYDGPLGPAAPLIPRSLVGEVVTVGALTVVVLASRFRHRSLRLPESHRRLWTRASLGYVLAIAIVAVAGGTHYYRDLRERQLNDAVRLVAGGDYPAALAQLDQAERFPSPAKPGRVDYLRGEAYAGLNQRTIAEQHYLRADALDPHYFWVVADLAAFYASADLPRSERERLVGPYMDRLNRDFASEPEVGRMVSRVIRRLERP